MRGRPIRRAVSIPTERDARLDVVAAVVAHREPVLRRKRPGRKSLKYLRSSMYPPTTTSCAAHTPARNRAIGPSSSAP